MDAIATHTRLHGLRQGYADLVRTQVPGPSSVSYFIPSLLLILSLLIPPTVLSHRWLAALVLPLILAFTIHAWQAMGGVDVISADTLWWSFYLIGFKDPRRTFRRIWHVGRLPASEPRSTTPQTKAAPEDLASAKDLAAASKAAVPHHVVEEPYPATCGARLNWILNLVANRTLSSFKIGSPSHDGRSFLPWPPPARTAFLYQMTRRMLPVLLLLLPLSVQLAKGDPYFHDRTISVFSALPQDAGAPYTVKLLRAVVPRVILRPMTLGMYIYGLLVLMWFGMMPSAVFSNWLVRFPPDTWSPHTAKPLLGPFSGVLDHGVRGFWGIWWHQNYRHMVSEPGKYLARLIGFDHRHPLCYALQCLSAFGLSGITHMGLVAPNPRDTTTSANDLRLGFASFFWIQPLGIFLEVFLVEPILRCLFRTAPQANDSQKQHSARGISTAVTAARILRFTWVICWFSFALTFLVIPYCELQFWNLWPLPFLPQRWRDITSGSWLP